MSSETAAQSDGQRRRARVLRGPRIWLPIVVGAAALAIAGVSLATTQAGHHQLLSATSPTAGGSADSGRNGAIAAGHHRRCRPAHERTIVVDRQVRIYSLPASRDVPLPAGRATYACLLASGRTVRLNEHPPFASISHVALSGTIVAYVTTTVAVDTGSSSVTVRDLAHKRTLVEAAAYTYTAPVPVENFTSVTDLVLTRHGSVAWIGQSSGIVQTTPDYQVNTALAGGQEAIRDHGATIGPRSLRLSSGSVSWQHGTQMDSAPLP
jgi:hypothetical protein